MNFKNPIFYIGLFLCLDGVFTILTGAARFRSAHEGGLFSLREEKGKSAYIYGIGATLLGSALIRTCKKR